jgi:uncharacterized membrane protein
MALATTLYEWLLVLHILAAAIWLGGLVLVTLLGALVVRNGDTQLVLQLTRSLRIVGPIALAPSMLAVLGLGLWMVIDSAAWDFGQAWIVVALSLFAAAVVIGVIFQARAAIGAGRAAEMGERDEALRQVRRWLWGMRAIVALLVVAVWDMVVKPGL